MVSRAKLNRLMNEIYETVSAACTMADAERPAPSKFPLDGGDGTGGEESVALTRSLTEKRKNYVRRVSSRVAYLEPSNRRRYRHQTSVVSYKSELLQENPYTTFRSWKSFRCSQGNLNRKSPEMDLGSKTNLTDSRGNLMGNDFRDNLDDLSLDDKAGCLNLDLPFEPRQKSLFDICLLVGFNHMTGEAYVKSVFPTQVQVPPHIENLVFPETLNIDEERKAEYDLEASRTQCYSLVLTNERGERSYGYCRRVLPEGAAACLPLCYCIIGRYRAAGFYYKVLQEIESHHGSAEIENHKILQQLFDADFPSPGTELQLECPRKKDLTKNSIFRNSVNLGDILKSKTLPDNRKSSSPEKTASMIPDFYDVENNNTKKLVLVESGRKLKRPLEPRIDEDNLSVLLDSLGAGLLIKVFGSLLLERKVVLVSDNLCQLSSCIEALQSILYPFVWQQPLISIIPSELRKDILEAPLPILAGMLKRYGAVSDWESHLDGLLFEEGMLIDISNSSTKVVFYQGDESTILPTVAYKTLKTSLQLESSRNNQKSQGDGQTRNVLIAEAFLRFFVDILSDFWQYFSTGKLKNGDLGKNDVIFNKESFIKSAQSKQVQYFLEWFTETAMFSHFVQNMAVTHPVRQQVSPLSIDYSTLDGVVDAPLPDFYHLFDERQKTRKECKKSEKSNDKNYKSVVNKKVRLLKSKLMDLVN
ncbi:Suppression of tumorigenicity 5 protein [Eumeta japonica]|uniref:Suppression of tumorigenicity 5 protein n=1 Tax=Eumeta variegata TaxID=151549 RepID=A0A4C1U281_EUMVA|nr:Suppression of tumorigenicity 5 protein [Eumeta japonica]